MSRKTIASIAIVTEAKLREDAPRARERILDSADIETAIRKHLGIARRTRDASAHVETTLSGGHVCNSYDWKALTDHVRITGRRVAELKIQASRSYAQKRPNAIGSLGIVRVGGLIVEKWR